MDSLISTFHIDAGLLLAQAINFGIIFFVLYKFAFNPLSKMLQERSQTIEKSLNDAKAIEIRLMATEKEREEVIITAKKEAQAMLEKAEQTAQQNRDQLISKTKTDIAAIVAEEKDKIRQEQAESFKALKGEVAGLVAMAVEKIIKEKLDPEKDKDLIAKALS
jgi:F-type H+-transporting ATPase subunit b